MSRVVTRKHLEPKPDQGGEHMPTQDGVTPVEEAIQEVAQEAKQPKVTTKPSRARNSGQVNVETGWHQPPAKRSK